MERLSPRCPGGCAGEPMFRESGFRSTVVSLWFRLITLGIVGLVFAVALQLATGKAQGWTFYLTTPEVIFEVLVRVAFAALAGIALGSILTAAIAPFLWYFNSSRDRIAERAISVAVVIVVFLDSRFALRILIKSWWSNHGARFTPALLTAHFLAFVVVLCIPRARKELVTSLDGFLGEKMTRRTAIATVAGTAALVATEFVLAKASPAREGGAGTAAAQVQLCADHVRRLECGRHVVLRIQAADHSQHRRFCPQRYSLY